jgi:hypothetical protein
MEKVPGKKENLVQVNETGLGEIGAPEAAEKGGAQLDPKSDSTVVYKSI